MGTRVNDDEVTAASVQTLQDTADGMQAEMLPGAGFSYRADRGSSGSQTLPVPAHLGLAPVAFNLGQAPGQG